MTRRAENDETKAVYLYENTIDDTNCFLEGEYGYKAFDKLAAYEDIIDDPGKLKLIDALYLERCEEINRLREELEEAKWENEETKKYNLELTKAINEIKNETIDEFAKAIKANLPIAVHRDCSEIDYEVECALYAKRNEIDRIAKRMKGVHA